MSGTLPVQSRSRRRALASRGPMGKGRPIRPGHVSGGGHAGRPTCEPVRSGASDPPDRSGRSAGSGDAVVRPGAGAWSTRLHLEAGGSARNAPEGAGRCRQPPPTASSRRRCDQRSGPGRGCRPAAAERAASMAGARAVPPPGSFVARHSSVSSAPSGSAARAGRRRPARRCRTSTGCRPPPGRNSRIDQCIAAQRHRRPAPLRSARDRRGPSGPADCRRLVRVYRETSLPRPAKPRRSHAKSRPATPRQAAMSASAGRRAQAASGSSVTSSTSNRP